MIASLSDCAAIETVKPSEDERGVTVRLHEANAKRGPVTFAVHQKMRGVEVCFLLQRDTASLALKNGRATLSRSPDEIVTLRLLL